MSRLVYSGNLDYYCNKDDKFNKHSIDYIKVITSNDYDIDFFRRVDGRTYKFLTYKEHKILACMIKGKTIHEICGILGFQYKNGWLKVKRLIRLLNRLYKFDKQHELSSIRNFTYYDRHLLICLIRRCTDAEGKQYMNKNLDNVYSMRRYRKDKEALLAKLKIKSSNVEWYKLLVDINEL